MNETEKTFFKESLEIAKKEGWDTKELEKKIKETTKSKDK